MKIADFDTPSMPVSATAADPTSIAARESASALILLEIASAQGQPFGHEYSTKLSDGQISTDRHLLTLPREAFGTSPEHLLDLLSDRLSFPAAWCERLAEDWQTCSHIHLGCEADARIGELSLGTWKVYVESADTYGAALRSQASRWCRVHRAYKWSPSRPETDTVSVYDALLEPGLAARQTLMDQTLAGHPRLRAAVQDLLNRALNNTASPAPMLLRVSDENTPRISLDLNLYPFELTMGTVAPELRCLAACCGVAPARFEPWLERFASLSLGHMAAGFGRQGQAFVTLYGGVQEWVQ